MQGKLLTILAVSLLLLITELSLGTQEQGQSPSDLTSRRVQAEAPDSADDIAGELQSLKSRIADAQLDDSQQKSVNASLAIVESNIKRAANSLKQAALNRELIDSVEQRANSQREALKQLADEPTGDVPSGAELVNLARETRQQLNQAQSEVKAIQAAIANRRESARTTAQTLDELQNQKKDLEAKLSEPAPLNENAIVGEARELELRSTLQCVTAEIDRLQSESRLFDAEEKAGFLVAKNEYWTVKEKRLQEFSGRVESKLEIQRRSETRKSVNQAEVDYQQAPELLKPFAKESLRIAELGTSMLEPLKKAQNDLKAEELALDQLTKQFAATENRVEVVGLTASVGNYLRNRKTEIPREGWLKPILVDRISEIEKYQSQQFDLQEAEQSLITDEVVKQVVRNAERDGQLTDKERKKLEEATIELVSRRREWLAQAITNHKDYLTTLTKLQKTEAKLGDLTTRFHEYINERILWIRSNDFIFSKFETDESNAELLNQQSWIVQGQKLAQDVRRHWLIYLLTGLAFSVLFLYRVRFRQAIIANSELVARSSNTAFLPTLATVLLTVGVAVPVALLMGVIGWRVAHIVGGTMVTVAVGRSLVSAAWFYFFGEVLRQVCRKKGLAQSHFGWTESTLTKLNRELAWFVPTGTLFSFFCSLLFLINPTDLNDTLERACFILGIGTLAIFLYRILHPQNGMFREQIAKYPKSWLVQSRNIMFWLIMAIPVILIFMIVIGYYYSATQMVSRLFSTIIVVVILEIVRSLVLRFIQLSRRKTRIAQSRARLATLSCSEDAEASSVAAELGRAADVETFLASENESMDENFERSRKLIAAGIAVGWVFAVAMIWADVFPALKGLDRYVFWTTTVDKVIDDQATSGSLQLTSASTPVLPTTPTDAGNPTKSGDKTANGSSPSVNMAADQERSNVRQVKQPVTLRHFLIALFVFVISIFAFKNLPAFIELVFLKHLPLEQSIRHAIRAITGYIILMVGIIAAGRAMYIGWNHIQWLATALTFGLAFGLQEIFANFIAGIILLLERPIRIGDIVEVDDVSGVVTKIRIRATTIRKFDQKELVIPNKEFITGRILNWTLADKVIRQTLRVGIAYGSDVRKAKEIIRDICKSHPHVLQEPKTVITFEEFGESSLNIAIRMYLKDFDSWWTTMDDVHLAIDDAFKAAGIEIAFPQRDLHIRTAGPQFEQALSQPMSKSKTDSQPPDSGVTQANGQEHGTTATGQQQAT